MRAVYHNHHLGLPLLDGCLGDQVPDVRHGGKDNPLVGSDTQIMLACTRYLKIALFTRITKELNLTYQL